MRRRILAVTLAVTALSIVAFAIPLALLVRRFVDDQAVLRLERNAVLALRDVPAQFPERSGEITLRRDADVSYALYDRAGVRVAGSGPSTADLVTQRALANEVADSETGEFLVVAVPIANENAVAGALRAEQPTSTIDVRTRRIVGAISAGAVAIIAAATVLGYILAGRITRHVARLRDATIQLGTGDFAITAPPSSIPELNETALAVSATARRLDALVGRERRLTADIAHQLRTPLTGLRAAVETELSFPRRDHTLALNEALGDIDRLERTIDELLVVARSTDDTIAPIDLDEVLSELARAWARRFARAGRSLQIGTSRYAPRPAGHPTMARHVLDVLVDNALVHGGGTVSVDITSTDTTVTIGVSDEGLGFDDSGATTPGHGHGLELAARLARAMHGRLVVARATAESRVELVLTRAESGQ